jgi:hypothetical protein
MSMQALNQLVARSIIDPSVVQNFSAGSIGEVLSELDFSQELCEKLSTLTADTWAEFSVLAYRIVKSVEQVPASIELPSPADGLITEENQISKEHVA